MNEKIEIGPHRVVKEADDQVAVYFGATPTEPEMRSLIDAQVQLIGDKPIFLLLDFTKVETIPAPVRRDVGEAGTRMNFKGIGMFGGGFQIRVVAKLINTAIALFKRQPFPEAFHDSREAALAWFEELRKHPEKAGT
jgi:hypothetical protein